MSDDSDNYDLSEVEIDEKKHDKLVENVLSLNKVQNVKKPSRTEPTLQVSEFNLVKTLTGEKGSVQLNELTNVLKGRKKHEDISQKLQSTSNRSKTLPTPLGKPQAERIRRALNYEKSRLELDRWEAFVTSNRALLHQSFPLGSVEKVKFIEKKAIEYPSTFRVKTELQKELEKLEPKVEEYKIETKNEEEFPLTLEELKEKRKEAAKLRAHQSFKEAKARRQNKIKSKKYHRILRREKMKQQLKEFEELQKTNPEEALKKLDDIEKARAHERFSLRHKGTGQWAKSKQVRAKYDKESRQVLAQQLAISRDLTQKLKSAESDSDDDNIELNESTTAKTASENNPWINGVKADKDVVDFVSGYRKFWNEQNQSKEQNGDVSEPNNDPTSKTQKAKKQKKKVEKVSSKDNTEDISDVQSKSKQNENSTVDNKKSRKVKRRIEADEISQTAPKKKKSNTPGENQKTEKVKKSKKTKISLKSTSEWDVEELFDDLEKKLESRVSKKLKKVAKQPVNKLKKNVKVKKTKKKVDLTMPSQSKKQVIDEPMIERPHNDDLNDENTENVDVNRLRDIINSTVDESTKDTANINPENFIKPRGVTNLSGDLPDIMTVDENEESANQRDIIMEAFEDDDIAVDFEKEKADEIEKDTPKDIDLNLPGWGSWAGGNIDHTKKKRRRFIIKMPAKMPRRDENKGFLIINEKAQEKIRPLQVSEVPFPFKTIKDFEASIRAPIGNTFVPETAFRKFIEPAVKTKMGTVIDPISKNMLIGVKRR